MILQYKKALSATTCDKSQNLVATFGANLEKCPGRVALPVWKGVLEQIVGFAEQF